MRDRRGVTLLEAMVTLGLVSLTFALTAGLMKMYGEAARISGVRGTGAQALDALLYRMRSEVIGAVDIQAPATVGASFTGTLEFRRVDRHYPDRLVDYPTGWSPHDIVGTPPSRNFLQTFRYRVDGESLLRGFRDAGASSFEESVLIANEVVSLGARRPTDGSVEIRLEVQGSRKTRIYQNRMYRRLP